MTEQEILKRYYQLEMESANKLVQDKFTKLFYRTGNKLYLAIKNGTNTISAEDYVQEVLLYSLVKPNNIKELPQEQDITYYDNKEFYTLIGKIRANNEYHKTKKKSDDNSKALNVIRTEKGDYYVYNDFISIYDLGSEQDEETGELIKACYQEQDYIESSLSLLEWELQNRTKKTGYNIEYQKKRTLTDRQLFIIKCLLYQFTEKEIGYLLAKHENAKEPYSQQLIHYNIKVIKKLLQDSKPRTYNMKNHSIENSSLSNGKTVTGAITDSRTKHLFKLLDKELGEQEQKLQIDYSQITKLLTVPTATEWESNHKWKRVPKSKKPYKQTDFKGYYNPQCRLDDMLKEKKRIPTMELPTKQELEKWEKHYKDYTEKPQEKQKDKALERYKTAHLFYLLDMELNGQEQGQGIIKKDVSKYPYKLIPENKRNRTKSYEEISYSWFLRSQQDDLYNYCDDEILEQEQEEPTDRELQFDDYLNYQLEEIIITNKEKAFNKKEKYNV